MFRKTVAIIALLAAVLATAAAAARDPITGVWVAHDVNGDGSTDRFIFSGPDRSGLRSFTLVDSYGSFCETDGDGTGSVLTGSGTASLSGNTLHTTIETYVCANGTRGVFEPPRQGSATLTDEGLDDGYYVAVRVGT